jgi:hypothetical protein
MQEDAKKDKRDPKEQEETKQGHSVPFSGLVAHMVVDFISKTLRHFPVIKKTPLLQHVAENYNQPLNYTLQQGNKKREKMTAERIVGNSMRKE